MRVIASISRNVRFDFNRERGAEWSGMRSGNPDHGPAIFIDYSQGAHWGDRNSDGD
jgi:hypothetical protein